jgi:hypothetical protein
MNCSHENKKNSKKCQQFHLSLVDNSIQEIRLYYEKSPDLKIEIN